MRFFTIAELSVTNKKLPNVPDKVAESNLTKLVENVLDPLRVLYGKPIKVNSGYRSPLVNAAIGGAKNSEHMSGCAADITAGNKTENAILFQLIRDKIPAWRQLINEKDFTWIHCSYNEKDNKKQILHLP